MTRFASISTSCAIDRDPGVNTVNHQAMIDELAEMMRMDGWQGAKVIRFERVDGRTYLEIEPGISPLTLDYLRRMKEAGATPRSNPPAPKQAAGQQGRLL